MKPGGGLWIYTAQSLKEKCPSFLFRFQFQALPHVRIDFRTGKEPLRQGFDVKPGPPNHPDGLMMLMELTDGLSAQDTIKISMKGLIWINQVDQMVPDPFSFLPGRFGGPDIQVPIDLHGIGAKDLTSKGLCQFNRQLGFPNASGTEQNDHPRPFSLSDLNHTA
jgi:hypothetical protein